MRRLRDSGGDGWSGNYLDVTLNGQPLFTRLGATFTSGRSLDVFFDVHYGDTVTITHTAGGYWTWPSEISFTLVSGAGRVLLGLGPVAP